MVSVAAQSQEARPSIKALAAEGNFRAIALWLNEYLVPQEIYTQVQAVGPGCLGILIEFYRPPHRDRLVRFICHRIWRLNSEFIEGVHIFARPVGQSIPLWQEKIRIVTPSQRQHPQKVQASSRPSNPQITSPLPPQLRTAAIPKQSLSNLGRRHRSFVSKQLKLIRAFLLSGTAVAAFILGCLLETLIQRGPTLPVFSKTQVSRNPKSKSDTSAAPPSVSFDINSGDQRPSTVKAALDLVAVMPHTRVQRPDDPMVTLVFGGEVNLDNIPYGAERDPNQLLAGVKDYQQADVAMVNLGNSLATADTTLQEKFHQHLRPEAAQVLKAGGVDIVSLTSDRTMDFGAQGLVETLETLDRQGIYRVGAGRNEREARRPEIIDVKGQRIAYLGYSEDDLYAHKDMAGVNPQKKQRIVADIRAIRNQVDWIVVNYHWGRNLSETPTDWQTNLARLAIDQGADLVVGHHPDQLQGAEIYKGRPIAYSLGDFIFGDSLHTDHDTAVMKVSLQAEQMQVEFLPVIVRQSQPYLAQGKQAEAILQKLEKASQVFEQPMHSPSILDVRPQIKAPDVPVAPDSPFILQPDSPIEEGPNEPAELLENWGPKEPPNRIDAAPNLILEGVSSDWPQDWPQDWKVEGFPRQTIDPDAEIAPEPALYGESSDWSNHWNADEFPNEFSQESFEPNSEITPEPSLYGEPADWPQTWEPEEYFPLRESQTWEPEEYFPMRESQTWEPEEYFPMRESRHYPELSSEIYE